MKFLTIIALMLFAVPAFAANECAGTPYRNLGKSCADLGRIPTAPSADPAIAWP
ncbi:MAG: hypothetical protein M5U09_02375 [Gammaproteobacteria bacterium]|nr:hypothetical protein [Gammaproteobacteria bacterium]